MWKFLVKNQSIEILEREVLADHQIQYVQFKFTFDGDWKKFHKVVQFSQCDEVYSLVLGFDGTTCYLPAELHVGAVKMSVFGYDAESDTTIRATTVPVTLNIRESGFVGDDDTPIPPTPDLYTQLLKKISEIQAGIDGKDGLSAYEIAKENGFVGTVTEWLESLKGADGLPGKDGVDGKNGIDGKDGRDGRDGVDGVTPDMSEYPTTSAVELIIQKVTNPLSLKSHEHENKTILDAITASYTLEEQQKLADFQPSDYATKQALADEALSIRESMIPLTRELHSHENMAVLDSITAEQVAMFGDLQQFQDSTKYEIQTINEELFTLNSQRHTHENKEILDSLTAEQVALLAGLQQFEDSTKYDIQTLQESVSPVISQAHWHHNLTTLNSITAAKLTEWDSITNLKTRVNVISTELTVFKGKCDNNSAGIVSNEKNIANLLQTVESLQAQIDNLHSADTAVTLFHSGTDALSTYGEKIYTFYNDGYRSLNGFSESYPNFCSADNDYALFYNQSDFNWGAIIYTMCTDSVRITPTKSLLISYRSGASDTAEMWLVPKSSQTMQPSETARFIYEEIQKGNAVTVPFNWLQSADNYTSVLLPCENIASGDYYLVWKAVTDNTHPYIRNIKVLEVS